MSNTLSYDEVTAILSDILPAHTKCSYERYTPGVSTQIEDTIETVGVGNENPWQVRSIDNISEFRGARCNDSCRILIGCVFSQLSLQTIGEDSVVYS